MYLGQVWCDVPGYPGDHMPPNGQDHLAINVHPGHLDNRLNKQALGSLHLGVGQMGGNALPLHHHHHHDQHDHLHLVV